MRVAAWLTGVGVFLDLAGVYLLLVSTAFWQETLGWPAQLRSLGRWLFEPSLPLPKPESLWGVVCITVGVILQIAALWAS
jgi:hypothetical protein